MCSKSRLTLTKKLEGAQYVVNINEYNSQRIANIIRRYQELRSAAEITAVKYERVSAGSGLTHGKDDIVCMLADVDQGIAVLSSQQLTVVGLLQRGYLIEEIGKMLGLSPATVKFHIRQAFFRLADHLNTSNRREKGAE